MLARERFFFARFCFAQRLPDCGRSIEDRLHTIPEYLLPQNSSAFVALTLLACSWAPELCETVSETTGVELRGCPFRVCAVRYKTMELRGYISGYVGKKARLFWTPLTARRATCTASSATAPTDLPSRPGRAPESAVKNAPVVRIGRLILAGGQDW